MPFSRFSSCESSIKSLFLDAPAAPATKCFPLFFFSCPCFSLYFSPTIHAPAQSRFVHHQISQSFTHSYFVLQVCVSSSFPSLYISFSSYPSSVSVKDLSLSPSIFDFRDAADASPAAAAAAAVVVSPSLLAAVAGFKDALVDLLPERAHVVVVVGGKLGHQPRKGRGRKEGGRGEQRFSHIFFSF